MAPSCSIDISRTGLTDGERKGVAGHLEGQVLPIKRSSDLNHGSQFLNPSPSRKDEATKPPMVSVPIESISGNC